MLSAVQQSVAVLSYIKTRLSAEARTAKLLEDPFFLANLDYNFVTLFAIYTGRHPGYVCHSFFFPSSVGTYLMIGLCCLAHVELYGYRNDCLESLVELVETLATSWTERSPELKQVDKDRLLKPGWYMSNNMVSEIACHVHGGLGFPGGH